MERNEKGQFVEGRIETIEEKLKRTKALKEAWKNRTDYISDIVQECPKIYNSWRAFMFSEKGKRAGHSEEWSNFRNFYNDVYSTYEPGKLFRRRDTTKPYSKENFIWLTQEEINNLPSKNTIIIEYNDEKHTIKEWAEIIGCTPSAIKNRYCKHRNDFTTEEILYGRKKKRNSKKVKDISDQTVNIRAKASKMISSYKIKDKSNNFENKCDIDIDWMINNILTKPCHYCGDTYRIGCDRIDNSKGHTKDNVVPCCIECNTARNNYFTYDEMKRLGRTIAEIKEDRRK